jgi:hypothetical protein
MSRRSTRAEAWFKTRSSLAEMASSGEVVAQGAYSVADAMKDYLDAAKRRGMKGHRITEQTSNAHIISALGAMSVGRLNRRKIEDWHLALAGSPRLKTGKVKEEPEFLKAPLTDEAKRKRKASATHHPEGGAQIPEREPNGMPLPEVHVRQAKPGCEVVGIEATGPYWKARVYRRDPAVLDGSDGSSPATDALFPGPCQALLRVQSCRKGSHRGLRCW